jgi:FMN reductase [NAD(P)H]
MIISEAIARRKSVRAYLDRPVSADYVEKVVEAGRWAPNAGPFHMTVLRRPELKQRLNDAAHTAMMASSLERVRMRAALPGYQPLYGAPVVIMVSGPADGPFTPMNCALAAGNMVLQATELGLASCFVITPGGALNSDPALAQEAGVPEGYAFQCAVLLGHSAASDPYTSPERVRKGTVSYID